MLLSNSFASNNRESPRLDVTKYRKNVIIRIVAAFQPKADEPLGQVSGEARSGSDRQRFKKLISGCGSMVEHVLAKDEAGVRFSSAAQCIHKRAGMPRLGGDVSGSNPRRRSQE